MEGRRHPVPALLGLARAGRPRRRTLHKGTRVIVTGRLKQRQYETTEGDKRTVYEIDAADPWQTREPAATASADGDRPPF